MEGFEQSGAFNTLACVEWELAPCENLVHRLATRWQHQNAQQEVIRFDIQRTEELFRGFNDSIYGSHKGLDALVGKIPVNVVIGGPPCQAYSIAGRIRDEHGMRDDYRNYLFESYVKVVAHYRPDFFLFENVTGMLSARPGGEPIVPKIRRAFDDIGYAVLPDFKKALFNVVDFGVPQNRRRIIILGVRKERFPGKAETILSSFYDEIMPSMKQPRQTVAEAIGDLPKWTPKVIDDKVFYASDDTACIVPNHIPRNHSMRDLAVFKLLTEDIASGRNQYTSIEALKKLYTQITGKVSNIHKYYVLRERQPSNTIPAHLYKDGFRHIHPDATQCRTITVREAARLQTFPDDYIFQCSTMHQYKMIGNAVPPRFSLILANALIRLYHQYSDVNLSAL